MISKLENRVPQQHDDEQMNIDDWDTRDMIQPNENDDRTEMVLLLRLLEEDNEEEDDVQQHDQEEDERHSEEEVLDSYAFCEVGPVLEHMD